MTDNIKIYTDGSCCPNPGDGGYAFVAVFPDCEIHVNDRVKNTTNNVMEITAVIEAIKEFKLHKTYLIYTDSLYVIKCATNEWKRKKNTELWKLYDEVTRGKNIQFKWVKAHNGDYYNELVDKLAKGII